MIDQITYVKELLMNYADLILSSSPKFTPRSDIHQWLYIEVSKTNNTMIFRMDFNIQDLRVTGQNLMGLYSLFHIKGMNTPSGSGSGSVAASGAAWNDSIDLYCTEHTKRQWQRHPKRRR